MAYVNLPITEIAKMAFVVNKIVKETYQASTITFFQTCPFGQVTF